MFLKSLVTLVTTALTVQSLPTIEFNNIDLGTSLRLMYDLL